VCIWALGDGNSFSFFMRFTSGIGSKIHRQKVLIGNMSKARKNPLANVDRIVLQANKKEHWMVEFLHDGKTISVTTDRLKHIHQKK
jgi:hypothetical protein